MDCTKLAILIAVAGGLSAAVTRAETTTPDGTSSPAYEYCSYYSLQPAAPATPSADSSCAASTASNGASNCNSATDDKKPDAKNGCGCDTCCDANGCCHEKLGHFLHCDCKIHPWFCWDDSCPLKCEDPTIDRYFDDCCCLKEHQTTLTGWIEGGILGNNLAPASHFNGPVTFTDRDDGQLNQFYGVLQRTAKDDNCGWFLGGDVDFMWGSDFFYLTAAGLDGTKRGNVPRWNTTDSQLYGFAMPQLYAETDYDDVKIKWGRFYTPIGYETCPAIANFFYTHPYTLQYGEPFFHTGVLASRPINENWSWDAGVVSGWNDFTLQEGAQFLGGITYTDKDYGSLAFQIVTGDESTVNVAGVGPFANRTMYSIVWTRNLTSRWQYVFQHDLGVQQDAAVPSGRAEWYGINQYLFYKINCCWTAGWRFEWFRDDDGFVVTGLRPGNPIGGGFAGNFYETSLGLNYKPNGNWMVRPELRYDWYDGLAGTTTGTPHFPFGDGFNKNQFLFGLDIIRQF